MLENGVTPHVGVWIETISPRPYKRWKESLPMWECGLKHPGRELGNGLWSHSPCGSVDWNGDKRVKQIIADMSLPMWECGLKLVLVQRTRVTLSHSPCGSVDWNVSICLMYYAGLRHSPCGSVDWNIIPSTWSWAKACHSPCGSVDWNTA